VNFGGLLATVFIPNPDDAAPKLTGVSITAATDTGTDTTPITATAQQQFIALPSGETRSIRLTINGIPKELPPVTVGIADIKAVSAGAMDARATEGVAFPISRAIATSGVLEGGPLVLRSTSGERPGCVSVGGSLVCAQGIAQYGSERTGLHRTIQVAKDGDYRVRILVRPRPGPELDLLLEPLGSDAIRASASSRLVVDPVSRPQSLVDGSLETAWRAGMGDVRPEITLRWPIPREIRGVRLGVAGDLAASRPLTVTAVVNGLPTTGVVSTEGVLRFPTQIANEITLRFDNLSIVRSLDLRTGEFVPLPLGINEVGVLGAADLPRGPRPNDDVQVPCGIGPTLTIDGSTALESSVSLTVGEVLTDALVSAQACGSRVVSLSAGSHRVEVLSTAQFIVESVSLEPITAGSQRPALGVESPDVVTWEAAERVVEVPVAAFPRLLEVTENFNPGWVANVNGIALEPVRVDGWRQAWLVPPGTGGQAELRFAPDGGYRLGLMVGGLAVVMLVVMAAIRPRRLHIPAAPVGQAPMGLLLGGLGAVLLVTGPWGVLIGGAAMGLTGVVMLRYARPWLRPLVAGGALAVVAGIAALYPWPEKLTAPTWWGLALTALSAVAISVLVIPEQRQRKRA
jgi:arabinofuranan 3-O-arabinosyltransferase